MITVDDRCELRLFEMYLKRRAEKPDEDPTHAYVEIYGEVVFEDKDAASPPIGTTGSPKR